MASKYGRTRSVAENLLSVESATEQVNDLLEYYDIDVAAIADMPDVGPMFERALDSVRDYVRRGVLEVIRDTNAKLTVKHHVNGVEPLVYRELDAQAKLAMDRVPREQSYARTYALMGSLCGLGSGAIEKLPAKDLAVVEVLGAVFSNA